MKTEWQFHFETRDFIFEKKHTFDGKTNALASFNGKPVNSEELPFVVRVSPDNSCKSTNAMQAGKLFITVPLSHEKSAPVIKDLAFFIAQRISFEYGSFNIQGGMIICKKIPETLEEEKEVGNKPYAIEVNLIEAISPPRFDSKNFENQSKKPLDMGLVAQHNTTKNTPNPVDKFLGFFKILEKQFPPKNKNQSLKKCLESNIKLFKIYKSIFGFKSPEEARNSFHSFIKSIVHARHRCAHLKAENSFGYDPIDPKIKDEVEPFLLPLEKLTYNTIMRINEIV